MSVTSQFKVNMGAAAGAALPETVNNLLSGIQDSDPHVRTKAWQAAGEVGAPAVKPLAKVAEQGEMEVSRAAKRAMWQIVRYVGRPDGDSSEKGAVVSELVAPLLRSFESIFSR